jgi:tetratricopeptide (TPR) repeat protein
MRGRLTLLALVAVLGGCSRAPSPMGWSLDVASHHAQADRLIDRGDREGARRLLRAILATAPAVESGGAADTRRVLLQDTHFRLARLALAAGNASEAAEDADRGLALGGEGTLFEANLLVVRGAAHEALGQAPAALRDYQRALRINEALLHDTLPGP